LNDDAGAIAVTTWVDGICNADSVYISAGLKQNAKPMTIANMASADPARRAHDKTGLRSALMSTVSGSGDVE